MPEVFALICAALIAVQWHFWQLGKRGGGDEEAGSLCRGEGEWVCLLG